jgi:CrcB protein
MNLVKPFLYVGIGGLIGSMARYALHLLISSRSFSVFPWSTFTVNIVGCLVIGLLVGLESRHVLINDPLKWLLITGLCGGFTTFSTFSIDALGILHLQLYASFFAYAMGSVVLGMLATFLSYSMVR